MATTGSNTTLVSSTMAESLTEFAGILGDDDKGGEEWSALDGEEGQRERETVTKNAVIVNVEMSSKKVSSYSMQQVAEIL